MVALLPSARPITLPGNHLACALHTLHAARPLNLSHQPVKPSSFSSTPSAQPSGWSSVLAPLRSAPRCCFVSFCLLLVFCPSFSSLSLLPKSRPDLSTLSRVCSVPFPLPQARPLRANFPTCIDYLTCRDAFEPCRDTVDFSCSECLLESRRRAITVCVWWLRPGGGGQGNQRSDSALK